MFIRFYGPGKNVQWLRSLRVELTEEFALFFDKHLAVLRFGEANKSQRRHIEMSIPGFTAERSVYSSSQRWRAASGGFGNSVPRMVIPQSEGNFPTIGPNGACVIVHWYCDDTCRGTIDECCVVWYEPCRLVPGSYLV